MLENTKKKSDLTDRLGRAAEAKKAMLAKFKPRPYAPDPEFELRQEKRQAEQDASRQALAAQKEAVRQAKLAAEEEARQKAILTEEEQLAAERADRKARKAALKADAKAKRELQQQHRQSRKGAGALSDYADY